MTYGLPRPCPLPRKDTGTFSLERAVEISGGHRQMAFHPRDVVGLSEAYLVAGRLDDAMRTIKRGLELSRTSRQEWGEADGLRILGSVLGARTPSDLGAAHTALRQALGLSESLGMRPQAARCHLALAQCHALSGELAYAQRHREAARQMFAEMRMAFWIEKLEPVGPLASGHISAGPNQAVERQTG